MVIYYKKLGAAIVAQLVERWIVVPNVAGSSPVDRPFYLLPYQSLKAFFHKLQENIAVCLPSALS